RQPGRYGSDGELAAVESLLDFFPRDRRRHSRILTRARAVGACECLAENVLKTVDVNALATRTDAAFGGGDFRMFVRHHRGDDLTVEESCFVRRSRRQRNVDVKAVGA